MGIVYTHDFFDLVGIKFKNYGLKLNYLQTNFDVNELIVSFQINHSSHERFRTSDLHHSCPETITKDLIISNNLLFLYKIKLLPLAFLPESNQRLKGEPLELSLMLKQLAEIAKDLGFLSKLQ